MYAESRGGYLPLCKTSQGCHVEDLAADQDLTQIVERFVLARRLYDANEIGDILLRALGDLGLLDDLELLNEMEIVYLKAKAVDQQRSRINASLR